MTTQNCGFCLYHTLLIECIITKNAGFAQANNSDQDYSAAGWVWI